MKKSFFIPVIFLCFITISQAQDFSLYKKAQLVSGGDTLRYRILYPENYVKGKPYPVLVFLHGSGERGGENEKQLMHGADVFLKPEVRTKFSAIVIFPQCPPDTSWSYYVQVSNSATKKVKRTFPFQAQPAFPERMVKQLTDQLIESGIADPKRIYLGGLSLGAMGTYDLLIRFPDYYAAAFTIAGDCNVDLVAKKAKRVPLWIFHGAKDDVVDIKDDRMLYATLKKNGAPVRFTEYADANHNSWDPAFAEPDLLPWLFAQHK